MAIFRAKSSKSTILLMFATLAVVLYLIYSMQNNKSTFTIIKNPLDNIENNVELRNNTYYNKPFRFSISVPDSNWRFTFEPQMDSSYISSSDINNPQLVVTINYTDQRKLLANIKIELFQTFSKIPADKLAVIDLEKVKQSGEEISVVGDVTLSGNLDIIGAYHVVQFIKRTDYPLWITMFFERSQIAYKITCQVKEVDYENLRPRLEMFLKSFRFY